MRISQVAKKLSGVLILALTTAFVSLGFASGTATAVDIPDYRLQISPTDLRLSLEPGQTYTETFEVQNTGAKGYSFAIGVTPFSVNNENYEPNMTDQGAYNDIVDWVSFSTTEGYVESSEEYEVTVTITVPEDVPAGGQYAAIYAQLLSGDDSESEGNNVSINQRVALVLYTDVAGETRQEGEIIEVKIPTFLFNPPISGTSLVENTGNVHASAEYILQVFPLFSDEEVFTNEENPEVLTILPETRRFNTISWEGSPQLGIFRVRQTVRIFDEEEIIEKIVFLCPIWFLFVILLIIFCAIFWLITRMRARGRQSRSSR